MAWHLDPGDTIARVDLHDRYGGADQGGISPCRPTPNVLVFSDPDVGHQHGYFDHWEGDVFHYCGEGQKGDQEMKRGNKAILEHEEQGRALRVFAGVGGEVTYVGEFELHPEQAWYYDRAPESDGDAMRDVIMFRLVPKGEFHHEGEVVEPDELQPELDEGYRTAQEDASPKAAEASAPDPEAVQRSIQSHAQIQNQIAEEAVAQGYEPCSPGAGDPPFDVGWWEGDVFVLVEVKSLQKSNETSQLRTGLGQVLDYEDQLHRTGVDVRPILAVEREPEENRWNELCDRHGVELLWPDREMEGWL